MLCVIVYAVMQYYRVITLTVKKLCDILPLMPICQKSIATAGYHQHGGSVLGAGAEMFNEGCFLYFIFSAFMQTFLFRVQIDLFLCFCAISEACQQNGNQNSFHHGIIYFNLHFTRASPCA